MQLLHQSAQERLKVDIRHGRAHLPVGNNRHVGGRKLAFCICIIGSSRWRGRIFEQTPCVARHISMPLLAQAKPSLPLQQACDLRGDSQNKRQRYASGNHDYTRSYTRGDAVEGLSGTSLISSVNFWLSLCVSHIGEAILYQG